MGIGNIPNAVEALEPEDLYNCGAFGTEIPDSILSTLSFMNTVHFRLRGSHGHRQLKWGDIKLETDPTGNQCLVYNERVTKTEMVQIPKTPGFIQKMHWWTSILKMLCFSQHCMATLFQ